MAPGVATKVIGTSFALTAFAVAVMAGLLSGNPADTILLRALGVMIVGNLIGMLVGAVGERTVVEAIEKYQKDHPIAASKTEVLEVAPEEVSVLSA